MNMPKSRDIQAKMLSPKVILNVFWLVTVKVLNSYEKKYFTVPGNSDKIFRGKITMKCTDIADAIRKILKSIMQRGI